MTCRWVFILPGKPEEKGNPRLMGKNLGEVARGGQSPKVPFRYFTTAVISNFMDKETRLKYVKALAQCDKVNKKQSQGLMKV